MYQNVGKHPEELKGGKVVAVGESAPLTAAEAALPHNKRLIDAGTLMKVTSKSEPKAKTQEGGDS